MSPLHVAFVWHMHQPEYRDPTSRQRMLPWVRLHASRAYFDMAWMLERHPAVRATFNFVPVLLEQIGAYVDRGERDLYWELSRKPARLLSASERAFVVRNFFSINRDTGIRPRPRYWSLFNKRGLDAMRPDAAETMTVDELRDLQVLFNLAWFGFAARREYPLIAEIEAKGRGYTEDEKKRLLDLQIAIMRRLLPLYGRLIERGQIEVSTTPYYHPILPLIVDSDVASRSAPSSPRPPRFQWPDDAREHVRRAVVAHEQAFASRPVGMWPAEGSVSPEIVPLLAREGLRWMATDEQQLWRSLPGGERRRSDLFRPYRVKVEGAEIDAVFRDTALSDLIGFTYAKNAPEVAVDDLVGRFAAVREGAQANDEPPLLSVILDGENPWEAYPDSGMAFLERLYTVLPQVPWLRTVRLGEHLAANPPKRTLTRLHSGSWIHGDYGIWIGDPVDNVAWRLLGEARRFFEQRRATADPGKVALAYDHILAAEGSDWFWWYGEPFSSEQDADFDHLFRHHLIAVYEALGAQAPSSLHQPLAPERVVPFDKQPRSFVTPRFDGDSTYFDWVGGGVVELSAPRGSMHRAVRYFGRLRYGFDPDRFYLRLEPLDDVSTNGLHAATVRVHLHGGDDFYAEIPLDQPKDGTLWRVGPDLRPVDPRPIDQVKFEHGVLELGIPFHRLALAAGDRATVAVHLLRDRVELERYPAGGNIHLVVPDEHFEELNWSV
jgi:alpha-amylase/alpha-mannosidase (GH57 family)